MTDFSYTIQGGQAGTIVDRGVLPRAIDLVFNSIAGKESNANVSCADVLLLTDSQLKTQGLADVILTSEREPYSLRSLPQLPEPQTNDSVKVDRNFSYAVFVSYAEVYNEKVSPTCDSHLTEDLRPPRCCYPLGPDSAVDTS